MHAAVDSEQHHRRRLRSPLTISAMPRPYLVTVLPAGSSETQQWHILATDEGHARLTVTELAGPGVTITNVLPEMQWT